MVELEPIEKWRMAGRITKQALDFGITLIKEGTSVLEVAEGVEARILDMGGDIAFPVNIGIDNEDTNSCFARSIRSPTPVIMRIKPGI